MDHSDRINKTSSLLHRMCDKLNASGLNSQIFNESVQGVDFQILRSMIFDLPDSEEPTICEYFFPQFSIAAEDVLYFSGVVTIKTDLKAVHLPALMEAITRINAALPSGAFVCNLDSSLLMFRLDSRYRADAPEDVIADFMDMDIIHLAELCKLYAPTVLKVANGAMNLEEFRHALGI